MNWQPIDFQGVIHLDHKIVKTIEDFFIEKEARLAYHLLNLIELSSIQLPETLLSSPLSSIKLSEAAHEFNRKIGLCVVSEDSCDEAEVRLETLTSHINRIFWGFTEILEGCSVELFQRVSQISIDHWDEGIFDVATSIKGILSHYIDDLICMIPSLEKSLKEYGERIDAQKRKGWMNWLPFRQPVLDHQVLENLQKTEKFLFDQYALFEKRHRQYQEMNHQIHDILERVKGFSILANQNSLDQKLYLDVLRLLKLLELNPSMNAAMEANIRTAINGRVHIDHLLRIFNLYYQEIKNAFFKMSLEWKGLNQKKEGFQDGFEKLQERVKEYRKELRSLMHTISAYRTFLLKNDPNPYVRSRWGFSEWIVGPEPIKTKKLVNMIYEANDLDELFHDFQASLSADRLEKERIAGLVNQKIDDLLHEIGQPLMSRSVLKNREELIVAQLKLCDEVGSPYSSTINYVGDVLSKVMRLDWKYHILYEIPLFHRLYHVHQGLIGGFDDPSHTSRLERLRSVLDQIKERLERENVSFHFYEMEVDISDMKTYLQDFLASVQRINKEKSQDPFFHETIDKLRQQLLDYRYLFGQFFCLIMAKSVDGMRLRIQFLFVDQYFESVETLLKESIQDNGYF
ncbi:MAG: hypothetical protein ACH350_03290 [Parachlamydiaceae bacterium]